MGAGANTRQWQLLEEMSGTVIRVPEGQHGRAMAMGLNGSHEQTVKVVSMTVCQLR